MEPCVNIQYLCVYLCIFVYIDVCVCGVCVCVCGVCVCMWCVCVYVCVCVCMWCVCVCGVCVWRQVWELRNKAEAYRRRAWGTHFSRLHLNQILSEQTHLWEPSTSTSSSLSHIIEALDLARSDRKSVV